MDIREHLLVAREATVHVAGRSVKLLTYNGCYPGPTLRAREGERVRIVFRNELAEPTNLHVHGMRMPVEVADPHRVLAPGESFAYEWTIPEGSAGTYWYHPHVHGEVAWQLGAGLVGAMVVTGPDDERAPLRDAAEHVLVLHDLALDGDRPRGRTALELHDGREGELVLVNGKDAPTFHVSAGLVRLRLINGSSARFYDLELDGAQELSLIGIDGALLGAPEPVASVLLAPGQRADLVARATRPGTILLRERPYDRGVVRLPGQRAAPRPAGGILAGLVVHGEADPLDRAPISLRPVERIDPAAAVRTRVLEYGGWGNDLRFVREMLTRKRYGAGEGSSGPVRFAINGREFDPHRVDLDVELGTTEIWEIRNPTPLDHPFHLHIHPFQVLDVDGVPAALTAWRDVVSVPRGSTVRIAIPFRDFAGTTMFHCHIVEHEDNGMMGHVRVADPRAGGGPPAACPGSHAGRGASAGEPAV